MLSLLINLHVEVLKGRENARDTSILFIPINTYTTSDQVRPVLIIFGNGLGPWRRRLYTTKLCSFCYPACAPTLVGRNLRDAKVK